MAENDQARGRRRRVAGRGRARPAPRRSPAGVLSVQLLPQFLELGALPSVVVGEPVDAAPAIYASAVSTIGGGAAPSAGGAVSVDECGCIDARGEILIARLDPSACECRVDVLDADGSLFPVNWATADSLQGAVRLEGALYLDPGLDPETPHGAAVVLCRRRYDVRAIRRYVWTGSDVAAPLLLESAPAPGDVVEKAVYVADLVAAAGVVPDEVAPVP